MCARRMSVLTLSIGQKKHGNNTFVGRSKTSTRVRLSAFLRISYDSWIRSDQTSMSVLLGHHSSRVLAIGLLKRRASAMALPSTGMRLRRCVLTLPMSGSFFSVLRVSCDGAIFAGWRATMGALFGFHRHEQGPPTSHEETAARRRASFCLPASAPAARE